MTQEEKRKILEEGLIVFDTCSLGRIYLMTREAQKNMVAILMLLKERIWIPAQVKLEFSVHHNEFRYRALNSCYEFGKSHTYVDRYIKSIIRLQQRLSIGGFHPYFSQEASDALEKNKQQIIESKEQIEKIKNEQWEQQKEKIQTSANEDDLYKLFSTLNAGHGFSLKELITIAEEGESRYSHRIPPGYMDEKEKHGIQKYGDLILWKEILHEAKNVKKDVLFISDDVKEDWNVKKTDIIRPELESEFEKETGEKILKLRLEDFIKELVAISQLKDNCLPIFDGLDIVYYQLQKEKDRKKRAKDGIQFMILRCSECGHEFDVGDDELCLEWESNGIDERSMGPEYAYCSHEEVSCPKCGKRIELTMHIWEYPIGAFNYQNIEAEGAEVVDEMNLEDSVPFMSEDFDTCLLCGERKELMEDMDICYDCYRRKMEDLEQE